MSDDVYRALFGEMNPIPVTEARVRELFNELWEQKTQETAEQN